MSAVSKVLLAMNNKIGNPTWRIRMPSSVNNTMIIGIDIYHKLINKS